MAQPRKLSSFARNGLLQIGFVVLLSVLQLLLKWFHWFDYSVPQPAEENYRIYNALKDLGEVSQVATFLAAILLMFDVWVNNLPKQLTVKFWYEGQLLMLCEDAYLAGESDIRQWGQQIGRQMCHNENLSFSPFIKPDEKFSWTRLRKLYIVEFYLTDAPKYLRENHPTERMIWHEMGDKNAPNISFEPLDKPLTPYTPNQNPSVDAGDILFELSLLRKEIKDLKTKLGEN